MVLVGLDGVGVVQHGVFFVSFGCLGGELREFRMVFER